MPAPAKLNLFLQITGRRDDGYHLLQTVFQLLDWGDIVTLHSREHGSIRRTSSVAGVAEAQDLSVRAARALQELAKAHGRPFAGADLAIEKHIPQGSGLGGASSDAATVLLGLNQLWGCGFTVETLAELGLSLGADVPVFVYGHSAWAEGVGEKLTPLDLGERWYVLVFPGEGASTAELFADPSLIRDSAPHDPAITKDYPALGNSFLPVLQKRSEVVAEAVKNLQEYGRPCLSGSGSTLFLQADDKSHANHLTTALKNYYNVRAVRGTDRSIVMDHLT